MPEVRDIGFVAKSGLCTGCGTCVALCLQNAVKLEIDRERGIYLPRVDEKTCNACGICLKVCPGHEVDFGALNQAVFSRLPQDNLLGNYMACYTGHAAEEYIRYHCSSGGLVSSLLIFALESKLIGGALVTRMNPKKPLEPQPFIARTREEILEAAGSKYCPVPANIALGEILKAREGERFAVVGLPCHMHGLRKAELVNKKLRERIVLRLGLFCSHTPSLLATDYLLHKLKIKAEDVERLDYRGGGRESILRLRRKNGSMVSLSGYWNETSFGSCFYPLRCMLCPDQNNELADIALGDAWLSEFRDDKLGTSILLSRNEAGEALLKKAEDAGAVALSPTKAIKAVLSQRNTLLRKKSIKAMMRLFQRLGKSIPAYNTEFIKPRFTDNWRALMTYGQTRLGMRWNLWGAMHTVDCVKKCLLWVRALILKYILRLA